MKKRVGKSLCLFSGKGGVGKTITTINLAGIFKILNKKVLIMDMDLTSGEIALGLNRECKKTIYNFCEDYQNNRYENFEDYVTKYDEYIDILASPKDPRQASNINSKFLEIALDKAKYYYDIVLIDMNHILNESNLVLLDQADSILFVINNDPFDIKNMKSLIAIFKDLNKNNYRILLNEAIQPLKKYFTLTDIENLLKANINYYLTDEFYLKNIDDYIMNGEIVTLHPKAPSAFSKDFTVLMKLATDFIGKEDEK